MNTEIGQILKSRLSDLETDGIITRLYGLVRSVEMNLPKKGGKDATDVITVRFPIEADTEPIGSVKEYAVIPTDKDRMLVYFEDRGTAAIRPEQQRNYQRFRSSLRLVGWYNRKYFQTSQALGALLIARVIDQLQKDKSNPHNPYIQNPEIVVNNIAAMDKSIFNTYTYYRAVAESMLHYPYGFFALDLSVEFNISYGCFNNIILSTPAPGCC